MIYKIKQEKYEVCFEVKEGNAFISSGTFGDVSILKSSLFSARIKQVQNCETRYITSCSERFDVSVEHYCKYIKFYISFPGELSGILVVLTGNIDELGISWSSNVINDNADWTVMEVTYPVPKFTAERFDLFVPSSCGRVIENAGKREYNYHANYPSHTACMQYFAAYGNMGGLYLGIHDGKGATKNFDVTISGGKAAITCLFYGIGAGRGANSFALYGSLRWQFLNGDWYDASMIYASFVKRDAGWLPAIGEKGRFDTADQYKSIPFWIMDYIPNSEEQGDNKPESLSAGGDQYSDDYWYKAAIELKDALKTPIAYHVYNWHKIPFNINYPHFNPAKPSYYEGQEALKKHKIYIMPYINAVSWETRDAEDGYNINFENTGRFGAVLNENEENVSYQYPQKKKSGALSQLAPICPSFEKWHKIIDEVTRNIENDMEVDGIYFDEISAHPAAPCYNGDHSHLPGGGSWWVDGYSRMMERIRMKNSAKKFYFSEANAEPFIKSFDGFLTWTWVENGDVPAFPAIYAGYIQMLGRSTNGKKKDDYDFFKYFTAKSLLYGQQIGWCKADVVYDEKRLSFLKKIVDLRYQYTDLFQTSQLLRPPKIWCSLDPVVTGPALWYNDEIVMEQVLCGAWQSRNNSETVLFLINISEHESDFEMSFHYKEYKIDPKSLPIEFSANGKMCSVKGKLGPLECKVWNLK